VAAVVVGGGALQLVDDDAVVGKGGGVVALREGRLGGRVLDGQRRHVIRVDNKVCPPAAVIEVAALAVIAQERDGVWLSAGICFVVRLGLNKPENIHSGRTGV
jgi:hypothetical protein